MDAAPIALFWLAVIWALFRPSATLLYLFFASMPFGSFAVIPAALTGGLTLTPTPVVAVVLVARQLLRVRGITQASSLALRPRGLLLLSVFWVLAATTTLFMPRLFAGTVEIVPMRLTGFMETTPLAPTTQNLSQLLYLTIAVLAVFAFARMLDKPQMRPHLFLAQSLGAALTVATGLLDFAAQYLPITTILEPFRTATYALLTEVDIEGAKRVVGLMPEASSYGSLALGFLSSTYFFRRGMQPGWMRDRGVPVLLGLLILMIWLSTSSAAYLGLVLFGCVAFFEWMWRAAGGNQNIYVRRGLSTEFWIGTGTLVIVLGAALLRPDALRPVLDMLDVTVLQKTSSSSFDERSMWTAVSWKALLDTYGLGVGLGGTRASNFVVALASNAGLLATAFYFLFVLQTLRYRQVPLHDKQGRALISAIRWAYVPPFATSLLIGTSPDFGLRNAFFYGLALALSLAKLRVANSCTDARVKRAPVWIASAQVITNGKPRDGE